MNISKLIKKLKKLKKKEFIEDCDNGDYLITTVAPNGDSHYIKKVKYDKKRGHYIIEID